MSERPEVRTELSGSGIGMANQTGVHYGDTHITVQGVQVRVPDEINPPEGFVNRERERSRARELLGREGLSKVVVFTGLPGAGKSAVARQVGSEVDFPGGRLLVELGAHRGPDGVAVADVLADVLTTLGVQPDGMPRTLERRVQLFRTMTSEHPSLVLLDDVAEPAEIDPFVPRADGSRVLVTSNQRLTDLLLTEESVVEVGALPQEAGSELMQAVCGRARAEEEPAAMRELSELCGGFPAQLRVAAATLRKEPSLRVAELVAEYRADGAERTSPFHVTYRRLSAAAARLYRRLGLLRLTSFGADLVAAVSGGGFAAVRPVLAELREANLLVDERGRRYRMHELVAEHAWTCAQRDESEVDREAVRAEVVAHYRNKAAFADLAALGPGRLRIGPVPDGENPFDGKAAALDWLDAERATLLAVLRCAVESGLHRPAWQLAESMTALYVNRRYLTEWVDATELGVRAAELDGRPDAVARLRSFASRPLTDLGLLQRAHAELAAALPQAEQAQQPRLLASVWELIGRFRDAAPEFAADRVGAGSAAAAYSRALELFGAAGDERGQAFVLVFLGISQGESGLAEQALATLHEAHRRCVQVPDRRMAGRARTAIGRLQLRAGHHDEAIRTLTETAEALAAGGDTYHEAAAREVLAEAAAAVGDERLRTENLERVLAEHRRIASPRVAELQAALEG